MLFFTTSVWVSSITSRIAALISKRSFCGGAFLMRARIRSTTSLARLLPFRMLFSACRTSSRSGGFWSSQRRGIDARRGYRLFDFMRDRRRNLTDAREAVEVGELLLRVAQPLSSYA